MHDNINMGEHSPDMLSWYLTSHTNQRSPGILCVYMQCALLMCPTKISMSSVPADHLSSISVFKLCTKSDFGSQRRTGLASMLKTLLSMQMLFCFPIYSIRYAAEQQITARKAVFRHSFFWHITREVPITWHSQTQGWWLVHFILWTCQSQQETHTSNFII